MRRPLWPGLLVLAVSLVLATWLTERYRDARVEVARLETQSGLIAPERAVKPIPQEKLEEETRSAEAVVRQLTLPWAALIGTIEQAATREVASCSCSPTPSSGCCASPPRRASRESDVRLPAPPGRGARPRRRAPA